MDLDFEQPLAEIEVKIAALVQQNSEHPEAKLDGEISELKRKLAQTAKKVYAKLTAWQTVQVARHENRPKMRDYIEGICGEFIELHGDRAYGDDRALIGGFATIGKFRVMLLGMEKGSGTDDKVKSNFGMANPEGYRKALRLMRLAEKFHIPIVCLVDTPAAYPGKDAEERGQAEAIARNLTEMFAVRVPIVVIITGEGGSGGALGIAVGDVVLMLTHAIYSVIPPEGCAAILWRDSARAPEAAEALKLTAESLRDLGVIEEIIEEPAGGAHRNKKETMEATKDAVLKYLTRLKREKPDKLIEKRYQRFARIGRFDSRKYASH